MQPELQSLTLLVCLTLLVWFGSFACSTLFVCFEFVCLTLFVFVLSLFVLTLFA